MLKRGTLLLMMAAIALGGGVLLFEAQQRRASVDSASDPASEVSASSPEDPSNGALEQEGAGDLLFSFAEADVESITIKRPDGTLAFSKSADGSWKMTQPQAAPAESGAIAFLLSQLTNPVARSLSVAPSDLKDFGLAQPDTTLTLSAQGKSYELAVGIADFSGDKLYVSAVGPESGKTNSPKPDSAASESTSADSVKIYVVSGGLENAVDRPTAGWLPTASETTDAEATSGTRNKPGSSETSPPQN